MRAVYLFWVTARLVQENSGSSSKWVTISIEVSKILAIMKHFELVSALTMDQALATHLTAISIFIDFTTSVAVIHSSISDDNSVL